MEVTKLSHYYFGHVLKRVLEGCMNSEWINVEVWRRWSPNLSSCAILWCTIIWLRYTIIVITVEIDLGWKVVFNGINNKLFTRIWIRYTVVVITVKNVLNKVAGFNDTQCSIIWLTYTITVITVHCVESTNAKLS